MFATPPKPFQFLGMIAQLSKSGCTELLAGPDQMLKHGVPPRLHCVVSSLDIGTSGLYLICVLIFPLPLGITLRFFGGTRE